MKFGSKFVTMSFEYSQQKDNSFVTNNLLFEMISESSN